MHFSLTVPTSSPDNVITSALSSTEIQVTWDIVPPIDQNGVITMYEVLYEPLETFDGAIQTQMRSVSGSDVSVVLTGLQESVNYDISVRAYTSIGHGPYSVAITSMTLENGMLKIMMDPRKRGGGGSFPYEVNS